MLHDVICSIFLDFFLHIIRARSVCKEWHRIIITSGFLIFAEAGYNWRRAISRASPRLIPLLCIRGEIAATHSSQRHSLCMLIFFTSYNADRSNYLLKLRFSALSFVVTSQVRRSLQNCQHSAHWSASPVSAPRSAVVVPALSLRVLFYSPRCSQSALLCGLVWLGVYRSATPMRSSCPVRSANTSNRVLTVLTAIGKSPIVL